ncbi:unnamed protein product, partial [Ceratitis capitata]
WTNSAVVEVSNVYTISGSIFDPNFWQKSLLDGSVGSNSYSGYAGQGEAKRALQSDCIVSKL